MSNQMSILILPWFTLLFMEKDDIKRYMPVGLFAVFASAIILETGETLKWWHYETAYPLRNISYLYGTLPVATMWLFKFAYRGFWFYLGVDTLLNLFFTYAFEYYFLGSRGIAQFIRITPFVSFLMTWALGIVLYFYHTWQQGIFAELETKDSYYRRVQPVLAKPLIKDKDKK